MTDYDELEDFDTQVDALGGSLASATEIAAAFDAEMQKLRNSIAVTGLSISEMDEAMTSGLRKAIDGVVMDGMRLSEALKVLAETMVDAVYRAAVDPVIEQLSGAMVTGLTGLLGGIGLFADGAGFTQGRVTPFATGGVVSGPTYFPMRGGMGLMGEAGPEAIMPLARGSDGKLGVRAASGGQAVSVVMNITTPDVQGFRRSQSQIAAQMGRALSHGQRNL